MAAFFVSYPLDVITFKDAFLRKHVVFVRMNVQVNKKIVSSYTFALQTFLVLILCSNLVREVRKLYNHG